MRQVFLGLTLVAVFFLAPNAEVGAVTTSGAGGPLPWEGPLAQITDSVQGPILRSIFIFSIIIAGAVMALVDFGQGAKTMLRVVFGLSIALGAVTFFPAFLGGTLGSAVF